MSKRWTLRPKAPPEFFEQFPEMDRILVQVLWSRGLRTQSEIDAFLEPDFSRDLHDPWLFRSMRSVVDRLVAALKSHERIVVYGDYDADGVSSAAVLSETFTALGGTVEVYIPFRDTEGYGLNLRAVEEIATSGAKLLVTVDCGTTNVAEVARANELGLDVIITDHHDQPPQLPAALAVINPELHGESYPFPHLAASGVALKVATALLQSTGYGAALQRPVLPTGWEKWLLDLVGIATVTDMVPMLGENRVFVQYGLSVLRKTRRIGLRELFATMRTGLTEADEETLAFQVGPRLNAAGRMNHASTAYQLLVTKDQAEARRLAAELNAANSERQRTTEAVYAQALAQIGEQPSASFLYAVGGDWAPGIVGLVASRLCERFNRPVLIMTRAHGRYIGSGRSIEAFDITAALQEVRPLLERGGGHPQACGLTVRDGVDPHDVGAAFQRLANSRLADVDTTAVLDVDAEVALDDINWQLVEDVGRLAPFGEKAEQPRFLARGLRVVAVDTVGKDRQHLRLHVSHGTSTVHKTIGFRFGSWVDQLAPGSTVGIVFSVGVNEWNGNREIELKIIDLEREPER